jgi:hypothetical protein
MMSRILFQLLDEARPHYCGIPRQNMKCVTKISRAQAMIITISIASQREARLFDDSLEHDRRPSYIIRWQVIGHSGPATRQPCQPAWCQDQFGRFARTCLSPRLRSPIKCQQPQSLNGYRDLHHTPNDSRPPPFPVGVFVPRRRLSR